MAKSFMGVRLRSLREERGITQAALAQALKLSPSYVNQIESNQRPITVPVLLRLQAYFGIDLQFFSEDEESRVVAELREITSSILGPGAVPLAELQSVAQQMPAFSKVLLALQRRAQNAEDRVAMLAAGSDGDRFAADGATPAQPHEEVREFFYSRHNHMAVLDERAEAMFERLHAASQRAGSATDQPLPRGASAAPAPRAESAQLTLAESLEQHLFAEHGVRTLFEDPDRRNREVIR